ncbi:MAG: alpha-1,4-glucan--maltose-1-phosphate maltosyltransferase [Vicinamibacterales bacterium]|nr:alpha-1,4-glucan--maltose-1-phosphate maltosyltransferase [Vicinamibacterales bacterium]
MRPDHPFRVVIENVGPSVDGGHYPVKRVPGEVIDVTADVFTDGHDIVRALVRWRTLDPSGAPRAGWQERPLTPGPNDAWTADIHAEDEGWIEYHVEAWVDRFATWRRDLLKKFNARQDVASELLEGAALVRAVADRIDPPATPVAPRATPPTATETDAAWLRAGAALLAGDAEQAVRVQAAEDPQLLDQMERHADRFAAVSSPVLSALVEPVRARFGAWYEMFPRSAGPDPHRSGTFDEAAERLPEIAALGFDVVYLPPVHPIGKTFRKGPNNTLTAGPNDPGSPWAIGGEAGGHKAVEPGLGDLAAFDRFVARARSLGLEVALDLAYQCSPDHPYVKEHPEWFRHRPDGTIKYAENPPKKYQDIYPFDFECAEWVALWQELKSVVEFWIGHGVHIFRVDNPHTKPFRFWQWLIREIRATRPGVIFLSEAFTRPKVMKHLAKIGFSQSYSYFTWKNTKPDLEQWLAEFVQSDVREYMRLNLFANTPDILHEYLQKGGRPAFQVRLILAATLGATYGIYSGFELCEGRAVPGTEEYLDSEKYQFRKWDWDRPGHIKDLVAQVNDLRRGNRALHNDESLRFHACDNPHVIAYSKQDRDRSNLLLAIVNLHPYDTQHAHVQVPVAEWGLDPQHYQVDDLLSGEHYHWRGEWNYVRLDPGYRPAHVLRVPASRGAPRPHDAPSSGVPGH